MLKKKLIKNLISILFEKYNFINIKFIKLFYLNIYKIYKINKYYKFFNLITNFINFKDKIFINILILDKEILRKNYKYFYKLKHCVLHLNYLNHNSILNKKLYLLI